MYLWYLIASTEQSWSCLKIEMQWILRFSREGNPIRSDETNFLLLTSEAATLKYVNQHRGKVDHAILRFRVISTVFTRFQSIFNTKNVTTVLLILRAWIITTTLQVRLFICYDAGAAVIFLKFLIKADNNLELRLRQWRHLIHSQGTSSSHDVLDLNWASVSVTSHLSFLDNGSRSAGVYSARPLAPTAAFFKKLSHIVFLVSNPRGP